MSPTVRSSKKRTMECQTLAVYAKVPIMLGMPHCFLTFKTFMACAGMVFFFLCHQCANLGNPLYVCKWASMSSR